MAGEYGRSVWEARDREGSNGHQDLLVFGYSCKLFRDNEKAMHLDKGKHLIPWMGDNAVMVDRYDVRGALYDLSEAEAGGGGDRWEGLSEEERAEEERCDYERYLALYHDEFQYQAFQDEEAKRLMAELGSDTYTYSQVGFNYDGPIVMGEMTAVSGEQEADLLPENHKHKTDQQQQGQLQNVGYMPEADEDTFVPPSELSVPQGMVVPETIKQNKIIVKTSKFIVTQGGQMEIIIKTKQAGNPMFGFLSFDNPLNAYYKHMVTMIKSGRYSPADEVEQVRSRKDGEGNSDQYLHPSLSAGIKPDLAPGTPTSALKPSTDCAYFKLINKIKEKQKNTAVVERLDSPAPASPGIIAASTPVAAIESSEALKQEKMIAQQDNKMANSPKVTSLVDYPSFNRTKEYDSEYDSDDAFESSSTASKGTSEYSNIKWPPPDVQMVIDKMASYIIKNGVEFETMVRSRDDPRFSFLKKDHEYFPYYQCKIRLYSEVYGDIFKDGVEDKGSPTSRHGESGVSSKKDKRGNNNNNNNSSNNNNNNTNKQTSTISFSIKSREQDVNLDRHSTFPVESSSTDDEDMDEEEKERRRIERDERRKKRKMKEKEERERREREEKERREREEKEKAIEKTEESTDGSGDNDDVYDIFKYAQEMDKDGDPEEQKRGEKQHDEEPAKESTTLVIDGSTTLTPTAHPEHKQKERRKKAAMFLSRLKKGSREEESHAQPVYGPQLPPDIAVQILNSASQSPRSSLGSTRHSTPSRSRSHSTSPGPGIPMPPREAPAPPPPPPPTQSPPILSGLEMLEAYKTNREVAANNIAKSDWTSIPEPPVSEPSGERFKAATPKESSVLSGTSEEGCRSQSLENRRSKSRPVEVPHREKTRSRKKQRHGRSESRSPSSRRERKKRKRSRSRSRRHKKRRSRSKSPKTHKSSHKKKRRKHSSRHERERGERKSKKSRRRSVSSSTSDSSSHSYSSSRSTTVSDNDVQVIESPGPSKRGSRASSVVSVGALDQSYLSSALGRIAEECASPPLPPIPESPATASLVHIAEENKGNSDSFLEMSGSGGEENKEEKKEEKKTSFDPQNSAAMAKIALGLRAKVHALLNKESKL